MPENAPLLALNFQGKQGSMHPGTGEAGRSGRIEFRHELPALLGQKVFPEINPHRVIALQD